jgi:hypothetical protein
VSEEETPLLWRIFPADRVTLSEDGAAASQTLQYKHSLTSTEIQLTEGKHYWEVELLSGDMGTTYIGTTYIIPATDRSTFTYHSIVPIQANGLSSSSAKQIRSGYPRPRSAFEFDRLWQPC